MADRPLIFRLHLIQVFPPSWDWRRVAELIAAVYQATVGAAFWIVPGALDFPVYAPMRGVMSADRWALLFWAICLGHAAAIYANGRMPCLSTLARFIATGLHMMVLAGLGVLFATAGAIWPVVSMGLVMVLVGGGLSIAAEDFARAKSRREVRR